MPAMIRIAIGRMASHGERARQALMLALSPGKWPVSLSMARCSDNSGGRCCFCRFPLAALQEKLQPALCAAGRYACRAAVVVLTEMGERSRWRCAGKYCYYLRGAGDAIAVIRRKRIDLRGRMNLTT